mmetsp:Transcript_1064/g.1258  ORF Transcript_1064/g.1258 Transcript_1064/m.1258 type:complete len:90 (-) Transcript_1064:224-493(-)
MDHHLRSQMENFVPFRGNMNNIQLEKEKVRFVNDLKKIARMDDAFQAYMISEFDKITDLQKFHWSIEEYLYKDWFKKDVQLILSSLEMN